MPLRSADAREFAQFKEQARRGRRAELELRRSNRILRMVNRCNEALLRADDEQSLIREVLRIILDEGGYRMAWVGYADHDRPRTVRPVAHAGFEDGYLDRARISWADTRWGRGPTGSAIRTGRPQVGKDFQTERRLAPWRQAALKRGFRSSIALPLTGARGPFGALNIYAEQEVAFDKPTVELLARMADNLAYGIESLRTRKALRYSRDKLRVLAGELALTEQRERKRLARILHDELQQLLMASRHKVEALGAPTRRRPAAPAVQDAADLIQKAIECSRSLTGELSPPLPAHGGLAGALEWLADAMRRQHGLSVSVDARHDASPRSEGALWLLYQSVRELLFNSVKHSGARSARVHARREADEVRVVVSDRGAGFDPQTVAAGRGFGLPSIRERLELLGGRLEIDSRRGRGSRFTLRVPVEAAPPSV